MPSKAVLLNSGGIDSLLVARRYKLEGWELHSLHLPLNKHNRGRSKRAAKKIARMYCASHNVARRPDDWLADDLGRNKKYTGYPHTVFFAHMVAAQYAHHIGADYVISGLQHDAVTPGVLEDYAVALRHSKLTPPPVFIAPYLYDGNRIEDLADAMESGVDLGMTQSCWSASPCGECNKCRMRKKLGLDKKPWYKFW